MSRSSLLVETWRIVKPIIKKKKWGKSVFNYDLVARWMLSMLTSIFDGEPP